MELKQVIVELRNAEPMKIFLPHAELYRSLTDKELPEKEQVLPGFELNIQDKQMRVIVDPKRTSVVLSNVPNTGYCVDNTLGVFKKVSELIKLPPLMRIGVRSYWIKESSSTFEELVLSQRERIFKSSNIADNSVDIGASFVHTDGTRRAQVAFGPMERSQLETMFIFKQSNLPNVLTFMDLDYYEFMDKVELTSHMLRDFIKHGLEYAGKQAEALTAILQI